MAIQKICLHQAVHNRLEYTKISIDSIVQRTHYHDFEWIVSDISSDAETQTWLHDVRDLYGFELVRYEQNIGQWAACEKAWAGSDAFLLSHIQNDIIVPHGWLCALDEVHETIHPFLVGAWHWDATAMGNPDVQDLSGMGLVKTSHIAGTCFILSRSDWKRFGKIDVGHMIYGFTRWQALASKAGAVIGYAFPMVQILHMDQSGYSHSLRETTYKEYTDRIFMLRHGKARPPGVYP
ncbi:MAG: hypothetical protein KAV00_03290 [Phycisphaerae bacterium]|nr:hypothetical protein [Phycisphaerae bacterium]